MIKDNKIMIGKAEDKEIYILPQMMNRHGLIAGATGSGKTVTLKVIAESLSELGVPTVFADVKGDLTGMIVEGNMAGIQDRLDSMGIEDYEVRTYPVHFFDVYQENGIPVRAVTEDMGVLLLSRILDLSDAQQGVLNIIFRVAKDMDLSIMDLKDLQAMTTYVGEHADEYTLKYGNVSRQSVGAIQRRLLELEEQGGDLFLGVPNLDINDWFDSKNGYGYMNIIECQKLFQKPLQYSTFLLWMLDELYNKLPEVGDLEKPKIVFFFDEAHLLFNDAPRQLMEKIDQIIKLCRSKGVGIFFVTQNPADIPGSVLAQLGNRIQHSLRAYTPAEIKAVKLAADSFRANPSFDTSDAITNLKTGQALVSCLDEEGAPSVVEITKILPPKSSMDMADETAIRQCIQQDFLYEQYRETIDPDSAFEDLDAIREDEAQAKEEEERLKQEQKEAEKRAKEEQKEAERLAKAKAKEQSINDRLARKARNKLENELINKAFKMAKKLLK